MTRFENKSIKLSLDYKYVVNLLFFMKKLNDAKMCINNEGKNVLVSQTMAKTE